MAGLDYLDFDLLVERTGENLYRARVLSSPGGQASGDFSLPFSGLELENFLLKVGRPRRGVRRLESTEMEAAKVFGGKLFKAVFTGDLMSCLRSSLDEAREQRQGLRLRLRLNDAPELVNLPWEYLYNPSLNRFLSLSTSTPLVRYLEMPEGIPPLAVTPPLRVLAVISSPNDYPPLDVEREWENLKLALGDLEKRGLLFLERLETATPVALQYSLRRKGFHIFHFIGHGGFDEQAPEGILLFTDENGNGRPLSGQFLGTILHDEDTLRLAVLNACEGARSGSADPFAGVAQSLVQQGLPAVIAMQFEVTDQAAITFAREFYTAIAEGFPVDAALAEARKAIFSLGNDIEWGTPVLYMRAQKGNIFDVATQDLPDAAVSPEKADPGKAPVASPPPLSATVVTTQTREPAPAGEGITRQWETAAVAAPGRPAGKKPYLLYGLGGLLLLALVAIGLSLLRGGSPPNPGITPTINPSPAVTATLVAGPVLLPSDTVQPSETPAEEASTTPEEATATPTATATSTATPRPVRVLANLDAGISSVAYAPDGQTVAAGSYDQAVYLWEAATGKLRYKLSGHTNGIRTVTFSPDGALLASGSVDRTVRLWSTANGALQHRLTGHTAGVWSVAFSPDGEMLASGSSDGTVNLWDARSGLLLQTLKRHKDEVTSVAFSPDGQYLASAAKDGQILVWQLPEGTFLHSLHSEVERVWSIAFSMDSRLIAYGSVEGVVRLRQVEDGALVQTLAGHTREVTIVAFSPDGQTLASGAHDDTIILWQYAEGVALNKLEGHTESVIGLSFSPEGETLASGSYDGSVRLWNMASWK